MMRPKSCLVRFLSLLSLILIGASVICGCALCESDAEGAASSLGSAEEALGSAYLSVLEAERAGGDVSGLVASFNDALGYLSDAEGAFMSGEYDEATLSADRASEGAKNVWDDAVALRSLSVIRGEMEFRDRIILSFELVFLTTLLGFLGWSLFKGFYLRRMMVLRPEVSADEP